MKFITLKTPNSGVQIMINPKHITAIEVVFNSEEGGDVVQISAGAHKFLVDELPQQIQDKLNELNMNTEWVV